MTGNKSFLTDYQDYDEGFIAFAGSSKGCRITSKATGNLANDKIKDTIMVSSDGDDLIKAVGTNPDTSTPKVVNEVGKNDVGIGPAISTLNPGMLGVQTQSHIGRIIILKLTYKLGGLLLLSPIGFRMEPQLGLYVRLGEMLGLGYPTIGIRARLGLVVVWIVFPRLDPGSTVLVDISKTLYQKEAGKKAGCSDGKGRRYEKGGIVGIVEGEAHGGLGLREGLLGVQTQSHIGRIIISKLTYKLGGLLLLSPISFRMEPQLGLYVRL
ncbi:hypothetical protein Tco_1341335, partial [Tanacetum coccineum]